MIGASQAAVWLLSYGYLIMFPLMVVEGPIVTVIASFFASLGHFDVVIVYALAVIGDLVGDALYYGAGAFCGRPVIERYGKKFGVTGTRMHALEQYFMRHSGKTLIIAKITHGAGMWVLLSAGAAHAPFGKFLWFNFIATLPKVLFFVVLGYFFGSIYIQIGTRIDIASFIIACVLVVLGVGYVIRKNYAKTRDF